MIKIERIEKIFITLAIYGANLFFALGGLIGYEYEGIESSNIYVVYIVSIAIINILFFAKYLLIKNPKFKYNELSILFIPFIFIALYLVGVLRYGSINVSEATWVLYFLLWSVPPMYSALMITKRNMQESLVRYIEIVCILITIGIFISVIIPLLSGHRALGIGGSNKQSASYTSAIVYGLSLYYYFFGYKHSRFKFTKIKIYRFILILMAIINLVAALVFGGRGAYVLIILSSVVLALSVKREKDIQIKFRFVILIPLIMLLFALISDNEILMTGFNRATAFINLDSGINWEGTSNRDSVYSNAIFLIKQKPIFGYGLFSYLRTYRNPHNIFLEVLLSGGIVYFIISITFLVLVIRKLKRMVKYDHRNMIWIVIFLYPLTILMFSSSYLILPGFWFIISLAVTYKVPIDETKLEKLNN